MQKDKFNEQLHHHAKGYTVNPSATAFDRVMEKRNNRKKRRLVFFFAAASVAGIIGLTLALIEVRSHSSFSVQPPVYVMNKPSTGHVQVHPHKVAEQELISSSGELKTHHREHIPSQELAAPKTILPVSALPAKNIHTREKNRQPATTVSGGKDLPVTIIDNENRNDISTQQQSNNIPVADTDPTFPAQAIENRSVVVSPATTIVKHGQQVNTTDTSLAISLPGAAQQAKTDSQVVNSNTSPASHPYKWTISALFTPQFINSVYSANSDADLAWFNGYYDNRKKNDQARFSYNAGIKIERKISKHLSLSSGILLSVIKFQELQLTKDSVFETKSTIQTAGDGYRKQYDSNRFDISFTTVEIPFLLNYNIRHKHFSYQVNAGVSYAYLISTRSLVFGKSDASVKETNDAKNDRLQQHHLIVLCGANATYHLTDRWGVYAGPVFRYQLNSLYSKDYVIRQNPYYMGLELGAKFSF